MFHFTLIGDSIKSEHLIPDQTEHKIPEIVEYPEPEYKHDIIWGIGL